jgi:hypothetical protein
MMKTSGLEFANSQSKEKQPRKGETFVPSIVPKNQKSGQNSQNSTKGTAQSHHYPNIQNEPVPKNRISTKIDNGNDKICH